MQRTVALKLIRKEKLANEESIKRFYQEIQAAAQVHHPNVVVAYDAGPAGGAHYFAMEYVEGKDLHRLVQDEGPLPAGRACDCVRQAAMGLRHAHERGLVHRDIKPSNLLLSKDATGADVVKILDMGLARLHIPGGGAAKGLTQSGHVLGTPDYLAPEQALDARSADVRSDLYSLGCTLYFLLTGQPPFSGASMAEVLLKHQMAEPEAPVGGWGEVPDSVRAILRKLIAKKPEDRFQTPHQLIEALQLLRGDNAAGPLPPKSSGPAAPKSDSAWETLSGNRADAGSRHRTARRRSGEPTVGQTSGKSWSDTLLRVGRHGPWWIAGGIGLVCAFGIAMLGGAALFLRSNSSSKSPAQAVAADSTAPTQDSRPVASLYPARPSPADKIDPLMPPAPAPHLERPALTNDGAATRLPALGPSSTKSVDSAPPPQNPRGLARPPSSPTGPGPVEIPVVELNVPATRPAYVIQSGGRNRDVTLAMTPDGHYGWYQSDKSVLVDLRTGKELGFFPTKVMMFSSVAFTPDSRLAVTAGFDGIIRLWSVPTAKLVRTLDGAEHGIQQIALSPDGKYVAAGRGIAMSAPGGGVEKRDCGVTVWELASGRHVRAWDWAGEPVNRVAFSADGTRVYAKRYMDRDGAIGVFNLASGQSFEKLPGPISNSASGGIFASPDGRSLLVGASMGIMLWDTERGTEIKRLPQPGMQRCAVWCGRDLVLTGGGNQVPGMPDWEHRELRLWNAQSGKLVRLLQGHEKNVTSLAASADGRHVLSAGGDGSVIYWGLPAPAQ
jgi:serine/threonine protein kinase